MLKSEKEYYIEENPNYDPGQGNVFLMRKDNYTGLDECIGGADQDSKGFWRVSISKEYDAVEDSDAIEVAVCTSRDQAVDVLWKSRTMAVYTSSGN